MITQPRENVQSYPRPPGERKCQKRPTNLT